jgi:hypothetical protein
LNKENYLSMFYFKWVSKDMFIFSQFFKYVCPGIGGDVLHSLLFSLEVRVIYDFEVSCRLFFL